MKRFKLKETRISSRMKTVQLTNKKIPTGGGDGGGNTGGGLTTTND